VKTSPQNFEKPAVLTQVTSSIRTGDLVYNTYTEQFATVTAGPFTKLFREFDCHGNDVSYAATAVHITWLIGGYSKDISIRRLAELFKVVPGANYAGG